MKTSLERKHMDTNKTTREVYSLIDYQYWYYINFIYIYYNDDRVLKLLIIGLHMKKIKMNYVFRQSYYDFSSRGRQPIQIKENGEIIFSEPGRNDR